MKEKIFYSIFALVVVAGAVFLGVEAIFGADQVTAAFNPELVKIRATRGVLQNEEIIYRCNRDSDCKAVQLNCCNCANNGYTIAINKNFEEYWNRTRLSNCGGTRCLAVYHFCSWNAGCESHRCVLR